MVFKVSELGYKEAYPNETVDGQEGRIFTLRKSRLSKDQLLDKCEEILEKIAEIVKKLDEEPEPSKYPYPKKKGMSKSVVYYSKELPPELEENKIIVDSKSGTIAREI